MRQKEDEDGDEERPKKKKKPAATPSQPVSQQKRERSKSVNTVAARMKQVVDHMISSHKAGELHPNLTVFLYKSPQSEIVNAFFNEMQRENAALFHKRAELMELLATRYDEFVVGNHPQLNAS